MAPFGRSKIEGAMARKIAKQLNLPRVVKMKDYLKDPSLNVNNGMGLDTQKPIATDHKHSSDSNSNSGNFGPIGGDGVMDAEERADFTSLNNNNMMNPNKFANYKMQEMGQNLFEGDQFAQQMANKRLDQPLPPPGSAPQSPYGDMNPIMNKDSREARRQERKNIRMANKGLRQARRERAKGVKEQGQENYSYDGYEKGRYDKKGDDIEYGKTPRYSKKNPPSGTDASFGISGYVNNKKEFNSALNFDNPQYVVKKDPKYTYKKGDLMDETDFEDSTFNSSRSKGSVSFPDISTADYSDIQEDKKGQYMTSLSSQDGEFFNNEKRPTSSTHKNFVGKTVDRDTLRPSQGKKFISTWKKIK